MPLDTSYLNAIQNAYAMRNKGVQQFGDGLMGAAADITGAFLKRRKDAGQAQADLDRTQGDVAMREKQLISELANIRQARQEPGAGQYEQAELERAESDTISKLRDIGAYQSELGAIGEITPRNVYKARMPSQLPDIGSAASSGRLMDLKAQSELERAIAASEGRIAAQAAQEQARLASEQRAEERRIAAEERAAEREAARNEREKGEKSQVDARKQLNELANAADAIDVNFAMIEGNKDILPKVNTATVEAIQKSKGGKLDRAAAWAQRGFEGVSESDVPKISQVAQAIETITAPIRSDTFGAALSVSDRAMSKANLPAYGDTYEELTSKLRVQREIIARTIQRLEDQGRGAGADFKGFESTLSKKQLPTWATKAQSPAQKPTDPNKWR